MNTNQKNDLILKNISFSYHEKNYNKIILDNFNCKIKKGKFTSIIGPSGTGKTSLLKLIAGLIKPEKGETYHLYQRNDQKLFLSIIAPSEWNEIYIGSFRLDSNDKWEKVEI